jgi:hypothetical protein
LNKFEVLILFGFDELTYCLPIENIETEIGVQRFKSGANRGALNEFLGVAGENTIRKSMSNVLGEANKEAMVHAGVRGKAGFNSLEANRFKPDKAEECTDINNGAGESVEGMAVIQRWVGEVIKHITNILDTK